MTFRLADPDARVDYIVEELIARRQVPEQTARLKTLGAAGVPRLLHHLATGNRQLQTIAFFGLQHCWTRAAIAAAAPFLGDDDEELRRMAAIVLVKGSGYDTLVEHCLPLVDDPRPAVRAFALDHVESERPDIERMRRQLWDPALKATLIRHLPRYHAVDLVPGLVHLLATAGAEETPQLLAALIHTNADSEEVRAAAVARLEAAEPATRTMAAEYLTWHGTEQDRPAIEAAARRETSPQVAAALAAAGRLLRGRPPRPATVMPDPPLAPAARRGAYERLAHALGADGTAEPAVVAEAWTVYRYGEPLEPHWAYRGADAPAGFRAERLARLALQARLLGIPGAAVPASEWRDPCTLPPAERFAPPHLGYAPTAISNYGLVIEETAIEGFTGLVHVGEDTAWHQPHAGVHSIAAGVVRSVACTATWGVVAVIEHREPGGRLFCSLYGHLSPFVTVRTGSQVSAGQKIGAVGRAFTWENGGYAAHLHFGIHDGPYLQPPRPGAVIDVRFHGKPCRGVVVHADAANTVLRVSTLRGVERAHKPTAWLAGYVSEDWFDARDHGWLDPRAFLAERGVKA